MSICFEAEHLEEEEEAEEEAEKPIRKHGTATAEDTTGMRLLNIATADSHKQTFSTAFTTQGRGHKPRERAREREKSE